MSRKSWLNGVLKRVSNSSRGALRKRPAFAPVRMEQLEDRTAPATLTWTGAASNNWSDAGNWTGGGVPSAANNVLTFTAGASVAKYTSNNDIQGLTGITINITDAVATANSDFTIGGSVAVGITSLTNNKTDSGATPTTVSVPLSGAGATITATAGGLAVTNTASTLDAASSLNVPTGATATIKISTSSSVGSAKLNLTGGALNVEQGVLPSAPGLYWDINETVGDFAGPVTPSGKVTDAIGAGLSGSGGTGDVQTVKDDLNPNGIVYWITSAGSADNMTYIYQGQIFDADGIFSFGKNIDDVVSIKIDGVNYLNSTAWNTPQSTTALKPDNDFGMGPAGDGWHDIDIRLGEYGGGAGAVTGGGWTLNTGTNVTTINGVDYPSFGFGISVDGTGGSDGTQNIPVDTAQKVANGAPADIKLRHLLPGVPLTNAVSVSGSSTVNLAASLRDGATFGTLTVAAGSTLAVNAPTGGSSSLKFTGATTLAGGTTFNTGAGANLRLAGKVTGAGGITKAGAGTLTLEGAGNDYAAATVVNAGTVVLGADSALGATTAGTTVNAGGQIALRANYNAAEPLTISGGATANSVNGFQGDYYRSAAGMNPTYLQPASGINLLIETTTSQGSVTTPRVDFGADADPYNTTTAAGYAQVAGGTEGAPLDRGGPAGYPTYNAFGGVGIDPGSNTGIGGVWTGTLNVTTAGTYRFTTRSDDGSRLWLGTDLVVENNFDQGMTNRSGDRTLAVGTYPIKIAFEENGGGWGMQAFWARIVGGAEDPAFPRHIINDIVNDQSKAVTHLEYSVAPFVSTGNFNFNGPITLGAAAQIRSTSGTLTLNGGINNGGFALHTSGKGTVKVATTGISGAGLLRRLDGGDTELTAANTFTGGTEIENGRVLFASTLGTGLVHIAPFSSLIYTGNTDLVYTGNLKIDADANIVSRNARLTVSATLPTTGTVTINNDSVNDNIVVLTSPLALTQNLSVKVGGGAGNGGIGALAGLISGGFGINKTGNGILTLANNGNSYTGTNNVLEGTLAATAPNAFGATTAGTVASSGASIGLLADPGGLGNFTLNPAEPLTFVGGGAGGNGALVNILGNNTVSNTIAPIGFATSIGSVAGTLTVTSDIVVGGTLTFAGAGNVNTTGVISSGGAVTTNNALLAQWYNTPGLNEALTWADAASGGTPAAAGLGPMGDDPNAGLPTQPVVGSNFLTGPLTYQGAGARASTAAPVTGTAATFGDNFSFLWTGKFKAVKAGTYTFGAGQTSGNNLDDEMVILIDLNNDGKYDNATERVLNSGSPSGCCGAVVGALTPTFTAGETHNIEIAFQEFGGGENGSATFMIEGDPTFGSLTTINPSDPNQNGMWSFTSPAVNAVVKTGTGTATLAGNNTYTGTTTVNAGTLAAASPTALGPVSTGTVVNSGGTLQFTNVNYSNLEPVTLKGTGALVGSGTSSFAGPINTPPPVKYANHQTVQPNPNITIPVGGVSGRYLRVQQNLPDGADGWLSLAEVEVIDGTGTNVALNKTATQISSYQGLAQAAPSHAVDGNTDGNWANMSITHTDSPNHNVWWQVDLGASFTVNSINIWNRTDCCSVRLRDYFVFLSDVPFNASDTIESLTAASTPSIGTVAAADALTLTGPIAINSSPSNPSSMTFNGPGAVNVNSVISGGGSVAKSGTGSATFASANTYVGNTTITGGALNTTVSNALGSSFTTSTLTVSGATSVLNLFNNATAETKIGTADFSIGGGTVNTGALGGKLSIKNGLYLAGGYTVTGEMAAQGANLIDNTVQRTLSAVSGTLDVSHTLRDTITVPDKGKLFVTGGTRNNTLTYTADPSAKMLIVAVTSRAVNPNAVPAMTYDGVPLIKAVDAEGTAGTYTNANIYYLPNPKTGVAATLQVNFSEDVSSSSVEVFTMAGVDTSAASAVGTSLSEGSPTALTVAASVPVAGSWAVSQFNYRLGTGGKFTETTTNGTLITGGTSNLGGTIATTTAASGNVIYMEDANIIAATGLLSGLTAGPGIAAGNVAVTGTGAGASGTHFQAALAVFAPKPIPTVINLPATNFNLATGTKLSINGPGDAVIGNVAATGSATIAAAANPPATLTIGGVGGAGVGTLATTNNLGLKLATGSSFKVDVNGTTAGTQYDQTTVNGTVTLTGATLQVSSSVAPTLGSTYTIINNDLADPVVGTFTGVPEGGSVFAATAAFSVSYKGGDGNDVVLTALAPVTATATTLVANPLATTGGSSVMFTATVAPTPGVLGTVTFFDNGVPITGGSNVALVSGVAVFSTTTLGVGAHPVTAFYSGATGFGSSTSPVQNVVVSSGGGGAAPTINTITFNGGLTGFTAAQRSRVINATVEFNQPVILDTGAMTLALHTNNVNYAGNTGGTGQPNGAGVPGTLTAVPSTDSKTWTLTWSGANTEVGGTDQMASLKDGVYDLVISATKVHPVGSLGVNMAANSTTVFHRLFGDTNAAAANGSDFTAVLAGNDNLAFRGAFNKPAGGGYVPFLDFNGDGNINSADNLAFRGRFNKNLTWTV